VFAENLLFEELGPDSWRAIERLFGPNGACDGCWCMCWRTQSYSAWRKIKGARAKEVFKNLVQNGKAHGILAFAGEEPIGWCSFGPRQDFPVLESIEAYKRSDTSGVWSITCFFINHKWRRKGLSRRLLREAVEAMHKRGVRIVEGYPATTTKDGLRVSSGSAWKGPLKIFEELGFKTVQLTDPLKPLVRLRLQEKEGVAE
jgi:GNAT superfamily N-acetyltransferase